MSERLSGGFERQAEGHKQERQYAQLEASLAAEREARAKAETDELTGLPDRRSFARAAALYIAAPQHAEAPKQLAFEYGDRQSEPEQGELDFGESHTRFSTLALLFADIDRFKSINDTYGHSRGDEVLRAVAGTLQKSIRPTDLIARWGGEEIVILLPGATEEQAAERAEKLRAHIAEDLTFSGGETGFRVSASFGVAAALNDGSVTLDALVAQADKALYAAKAGGRNRVVVASSIFAGEPTQE